MSFIRHVRCDVHVNMQLVYIIRLKVAGINNIQFMGWSFVAICAKSSVTRSASIKFKRASKLPSIQFLWQHSFGTQQIFSRQLVRAGTSSKAQQCIHILYTCAGRGCVSVFVFGKTKYEQIMHKQIIKRNMENRVNKVNSI